MKKESNKKSAFTLVELAIVIVIIGLLVGGVLQGQELIKQAEVRSVIKQVQDYEAAIRIFKEKYGKYPGDINNATTYLGSTAVSPGNGDNNINLVSETLALWQHLGLAKMIKGNFTGTATGTAWAEIGTNVPEFAVRNASAWVYYDTALHYTRTLGNIFLIGGRETTSSNSGLSEGFISPIEAFQVDNKMDDGLPATGKLFGGKGDITTSGACVTPDYKITTTAAAPTAYDLSSTVKSCAFIYSAGF